jgi:menaquinone-dependent protoporphyrinogen oxidase
MYSKYSWPLKWLMKRIAKQAGEDTDTARDYEYTDWQQVAAYAMRLSKA